jgi:hypothetical protein
MAEEEQLGCGRSVGRKGVEVMGVEAVSEPRGVLPPRRAGWCGDGKVWLVLGDDGDAGLLLYSKPCERESG